MYSQARAIVWAQWRTLLNYYPRSSKTGIVFTILLSALWYGMWAFGAFVVGDLLSDAENQHLLDTFVPVGLLLVFLYWQVVPLLLVATGASLDIRRLLVYPIPHSQLFSIEALLRMATGMEMALVLCGASVGLWLNPEVPFWGPLAFVPYVLMNLFISAGLRDLLGRLLARKRVREVLVFLLVLMAALPQLLVSSGIRSKVAPLFEGEPLFLLPWTAAGRLATGRLPLMNLVLVAGWTILAYLFGRWQFERSLRFDADAARASESNALAAGETDAGGLFERLYRLPSVLLPDPLGALVEKELRFLSRAPRFRLLFLMGFSFGLLVWLPVAFGHSQRGTSAFAENYLTFVSVYALLLLGEVCFWNIFGFDRSAAQVYFLVPVRLSTVMIGKNIAALFFILVEVTAITLVCGLLRMPITPLKLIEAYSVTLVVTLYLLGIGNLTSTYNPRPVNPANSFRTSSAGRVQALLMLIYPLAAIPVGLAFLARYALDSEIAFFAVLTLAALLGGVVYSIAMESAVGAAERKKEQLLAALSQGEGPIAG